MSHCAPGSVTMGELETAQRRALNILDAWLAITGAVEPGTSWYYELQRVVEDAVHCGAQAATGDYRKLENEPRAAFAMVRPWRRAKGLPERRQ